MMRFIRNNLRQPANCTGTVYVSFVIKEDGSVADAQVVKGIGQACDTEALRLFTIMPKWKPGKNDGKEVAFKYSIPVRFQPKD